MSNIEKPINPNYCATVVTLKDLIPIAGFDNIFHAVIFGFRVIVGKDTNKLGVFFPAETQLSDEFCFENNLYRRGDLNKNQDKKGYFEDNRRVRAVKFKGNVSNGFFIPLDSLEYTGEINLKEGDMFDHLNGKEICRKYVVREKEAKEMQVAKRKFTRTNVAWMPEHNPTENFFRNAGNYDPDTEVIVTQKLHGTSIRVANTMVNRKKTLWERIAQLFGAQIAETEYEYLYGSKRVIKDANNIEQIHYYAEDIWTIEGRKIDNVLPENYIVYGELIGWTPSGKEIQRDYTYNLPVGSAELYVYRVAIVNGKGHVTDLSWDQVKEFCKMSGIKHVPELFRTTLKILVANDFEVIHRYLDTRYSDVQGISGTVYLGEDKEIVDEGVCVRIDGINPKILKAKSPKFFEHETKMLDAGDEDIESSQS